MYFNYKTHFTYLNYVFNKVLVFQLLASTGFKTIFRVSSVS